MAGEMFKVGDTARPKSGGPLMTITGVGGDEDGQPVVWTVWFHDGKENQGYYPAAALAHDDGSVIVG